MDYNFRARKTALWLVDRVPRIGDMAVTEPQRTQVVARVTEGFQQARRQVATATGLPIVTHPFEVVSRGTLLEESVDQTIIEESGEYEEVWPPLRAAMSSWPGRFVIGHLTGGIAAATAVIEANSGGVERVYRGRNYRRTVFPVERLAGMSPDKTALGEGPEVQFHLLDIAAEETTLAHVSWLMQDRSVRDGEDKRRLIPISTLGDDDGAKFLMGYQAMAKFWALELAAQAEPLLTPELPYSTGRRGLSTRIRLGDSIPGMGARALSAEWVDTVAATMADRTFPVAHMATREHLPTPQEWRDPKAWITRVGGSGGGLHR